MSNQERIDRLSHGERKLYELLRSQAISTESNANLGITLGLSQWTVSRHLALLQALDLVRVEGASNNRVIYA